MKYILIDTNLFIYSAVPRETSHRIESFDYLFTIIEEEKAVILLPEIIEIEYNRNIKVARNIFVQTLEDLKKQLNRSTKIFNNENSNIVQSISSIIKKFETEYDSMMKEIPKIFKHELVRRIPLNEEILNASILRCIRGLKPCMKNHQRYGKKENTFSWLGDSLIIESLRFELEKIGKRNDKLIFCSDDKKDFAEHDDKKKKYKSKIHPDISNNLSVRISYYENLKGMFSKEFDIKITDETEHIVDKRKDLIRGLLDFEPSNFIHELRNTFLGGSMLAGTALGEGLLASTVTSLPEGFAHSSYYNNLVHSDNDFDKGEGM